MTEALPANEKGARLTAIEITNYRAFSGTFRLDLPNGENVIIYGENGSGKSSLYHSLRTFLEAPDLRTIDRTSKRSRSLTVDDDAHRFTKGQPALKLEIDGVAYEWTEIKNDTKKEIIRLVNQGKGFLDYKALLEVHYVREGDDASIDLFPLFIKRLLSYYTYPSPRTLTFQAGWTSLNGSVGRRWRSPGLQVSFLQELAAFNDALERTVNDLGKHASAMLKTFGDDFAVDFGFEKAQFQTGPKRIVPPQIVVKPAYRNMQVDDYHDFFNEAKLTALAICVFFAALKDSPATGLRILALDDVLIGLDMGNRSKVLDLVHEHFSQWQILILTYSRAWFESVKDRVKALWPAAGWLSIVLWEEKQGAGDSPRIVAEGSGDLLEMAERHLRHRDFTAAAVYARKALEFCCHRVCAKASLSVIHVDVVKHRQLQDFVDVLRVRLGEIIDVARRARGLELMNRLERAKGFVLNPNAHFDVEEEDVLSGEVAAGLGACLSKAHCRCKELDNKPWEMQCFSYGEGLPSVFS